jgi:hypothetical protein
MPYKRLTSTILVAVQALAVLATTFVPSTPAIAAGICPAVGVTTGCGLILTIAADGKTTVTNTGQGPYDGIEDTLVGVVNNSNLPLRALGLNSAESIFGFDGDGLTAFGIPGNSKDASGYGGPNAYYTNITAPGKGVVNFVNPIPKGGSGYFALEEDLTKAVSCKEIINNTVTKNDIALSLNNTFITATFRPNLGLSMTEAAADCGFKAFNWQQYITHLPDPSPFFEGAPGTAGVRLTSKSVPFLDPPKGGYTYMEPGDINSHPYYWSLTGPASNFLSLAAHTTSNSLDVMDQPEDHCLFGANPLSPNCGGKTAKKGEYVGFETHLVGVLPDNSPQKLGISFKWRSDYTGKSGGVSVLHSGYNDDDGTGGVGGITIDSIDSTSDYDYQGLTVTSGNPGTQTVDVTTDNHGTLNPKSDGRLKLTVPSTATFDATTIQPQTVSFGPNGTASLDYKLTQNGNGKKDLTLSFKISDSGIVAGDTQACLSGLLADGSSFQGCAAIVTSKP